MLDERHSSTYFERVRTYGYLPPEYRQYGELSPTSDVYSFGVMVLEIATGRRATFLNSEDSLIDVAFWVWELYQTGEVLRAADMRLAFQFDESEMRRLLVLGLVCTSEDPQARPTIKDLLRILLTASDPSPPQDWHLRRGYYCSQWKALVTSSEGLSTPQ